MPYWDTRGADAANIRLYQPGRGWRAWSDEPAPDEDGGQPRQGSAGEIGSALLNVLNSTNVVILTGTGSSFAAVNASARPAPAGMSQVWSAVRDAVGADDFDAVVTKFGTARVGQNIEKLLTLSKLFLELHEGEPLAASDNGAGGAPDVLAMNTFVRTAEAAILERVDFVDGHTALDAHGALIRKIGRRGVRKPRAKLFTTNYDLCFEEAARRSRFTLIDGFSHNLDQTYDRTNFALDVVRRDGGRDAPDFVPNVLQFYKLHGSIDWRRVDGDILRTRVHVGDPVLIYPRSSKFQESFDVPYLDMISAFQAAIREPDTALLITGFGFSDDHISSPIMSAVESNTSLRVAVCDPAFLSDELLCDADHDITGGAFPQNRFLAKLLRLADAGDARIQLMNGRFQDLAIALPDLIGETDRERHVARMRNLREPGTGQ
mgnify:CR=1 FL=1